MPRIRQNMDEYRRKDFQMAVRRRKAELELGDRELAEACGMAHTTLWRRIADPDSMKVGELIRLIRAAGLTEDDVLGLLGVRKGGGLSIVRKENTGNG